MRKLATICILACIVASIVLPLLPTLAPSPWATSPGGRIAASLPPDSSDGGFDFRWHTPSYPLVYPLDYMGGAAYDDFDATLDPYAHWSNVTGGNATSGFTRLTVVNASYGGAHHRALFLDWGSKVQGWETLEEIEGVNFTFPAPIAINNTMAAQNFEFDYSVPDVWGTGAIDVQHWLKFYNSSEVYPYELDDMGARTISLMKRVNVDNTVGTEKIKLGGVEANYRIEVDHWYRLRVSFYNTTHYGLSIANYSSTGMGAWTVYDPVTWDTTWLGRTNTDIVRAVFHRQSGDWMVPNEFGAAPKYYISNVTYTNMTVRHDAPIAVTSDADWLTYADDGDGSVANPWVIEDYDIDALATGTGISISGTSDHVLFRDVTVNNTEAGGTYSGIFMQGVTNVDFDDLFLDIILNYGFVVLQSGHITFSNIYVNQTVLGTYVESSWDVSIKNATYMVESAGMYVWLGTLLTGNGSTSVVMENCSFGDPARQWLIATGSNVTVSNFTFAPTGPNNLLETQGTGHIAVSESVITNHTNLYTGGNVTFDRCWYTDYFDIYPNAELVNSTTDVLDTPYQLEIGNNDTHPRYLASMWPRADLVTVTFYNTVDGSAIAFGVFDVIVNGVNATNPITSGYVIFHLVVENGGIVYHDSYYNVNVTGATFAVGIAWSFQIFVRYNSTLDSFGIEFYWFILYLDGVECPIFNPFVVDRTILITVRDFAGRLLYSHLYDFTFDSKFVKIPLAVTTMVVSNNFDVVDVIFHYEIAGVENSFPLGAGRSFEIRVALGNYLWYITDTRNHPIEDLDGDDIFGRKSITGPDFVDFGWVTVVPPPGPTGEPNIWAYVAVIVAAVAAFGIVITLRIPKKARVPKKSRSTYPGVHTH